MLQTVTPTMQAQFADFFLRKTQGSFEVFGTGLGPITPGGLSTQRLVWIWWGSHVTQNWKHQAQVQKPFRQSGLNCQKGLLYMKQLLQPGQFTLDGRIVNIFHVLSGAGWAKEATTSSPIEA